MVFIKEECSRPPYVKPPEGWSCKKSEGLGPFVTSATFKSPEGHLLKWSSRHHRKHHFKLDISYGSTWWAPGAVGWWIGILFAIGSICFALGAFPPYTSMVGGEKAGVTFFVGSLFFTTAAFLQYVETTNTPMSLDFDVQERLRIFTWEPKRIDWWATLVQFGGTLFFNVSTLAALQSYFLISQMDRMIWSPDVYGSICFLIASFLVWSEVNHSLWSRKPHNIPWSIAAFNLMGAVAFGVSAAASYISPTGHQESLLLTNLGTFVGGICFLIAALLLLPERTRLNSPPITPNL